MTIPGERRIGDQRKKSVMTPIQKAPSRYKQFLDGSITVEDLTDDELIRGRLAGPSGKFSGAIPAMMPSQIQRALVSELQRRMNDRFRKHAFDAIDTIVEVMDVGEGASRGPMQKDGTGRFIAAKYVVERIIGKIPEKVEVQQNTTIWDGMKDGGGLLVDVEADIEDAEIVEEIPPKSVKRGPRTRPKRVQNPKKATE